LSQRFRVRLHAEGGYVAFAEFAPVGKSRRKRSPDLTRAKLQKTMARPAREGAAQALCQIEIKDWDVVLFDQGKTSVRSQDQG
jgi:hypothetical protein